MILRHGEWSYLTMSAIFIHAIFVKAFEYHEFESIEHTCICTGKKIRAETTYYQDHQEHREERKVQEEKGQVHTAGDGGHAQ